jgi:hypothetical protein
MKSLVVYSSKTGNTRKLAEAVYERIKGEKDISPIEKAPAPDAYDLIVLGFWLKGGKPDSKSVEYLSKIGASRLFLLSTHGAAADSEHAFRAMRHAESLAPDAVILGSFQCQGEVDPGFLEKARRKDPPPPWIRDAATAVGHPNETDIERLVRVVEKDLPEFVG